MNGSFFNATSMAYHTHIKGLMRLVYCHGCGKVVTLRTNRLAHGILPCAENRLGLWVYVIRNCFNVKHNKNEKKINDSRARHGSLHGRCKKG